MSSVIRKSVKQKWPSPPIAKLVGFHLISAKNGNAVCALRTAAKHLNTIGTVHGGVLCDLADAAMGFAFLSLLPSREVGVTVELKINFLAPVYAGECLKAIAKTLSRGRSLYYLECEVRNARKHLVAKASCTCKVVKERKK